MINRNISDNDLMNFLNTLKIIILSTNARVSLICLSPSFLFRMNVRSFHCLFNERLKTLKMSSIDASDEVYDGINAIFALHLSSRSKTSFVLWILELSIVIIILRALIKDLILSIKETYSKTSQMSLCCS